MKNILKTILLATFLFVHLSEQASFSNSLQDLLSGTGSSYLKEQHESLENKQRTLIEKQQQKIEQEQQEKEREQNKKDNDRTQTFYGFLKAQEMAATHPHLEQREHKQ